MSSKVQLAIDAERVELSGIIDRVSVVDLLAELKIEQLSYSHIVLDFSQVSLVDTAGLAWLLHLRGDAEHVAQSLEFVGLPQQLLELAELTGVAELLS